MPGQFDPNSTQSLWKMIDEKIDFTALETMTSSKMGNKGIEVVTDAVVRNGNYSKVQFLTTTVLAAITIDGQTGNSLVGIVFPAGTVIEAPITSMQLVIPLGAALLYKK